MPKQAARPTHRRHPPTIFFASCVLGYALAIPKSSQIRAAIGPRLENDSSNRLSERISYQSIFCAQTLRRAPVTMEGRLEAASRASWYPVHRSPSTSLRTNGSREMRARFAFIEPMEADAAMRLLTEERLEAAS
jgi:hypothetical protein